MAEPLSSTTQIQDVPEYLRDYRSALLNAAFRTVFNPKTNWFRQQFPNATYVSGLAQTPSSGASGSDGAAPGGTATGGGESRTDVPQTEDSFKSGIAGALAMASGQMPKILGMVWDPKTRTYVPEKYKPVVTMNEGGNLAEEVAAAYEKIRQKYDPTSKGEVPEYVETTTLEDFKNMIAGGVRNPVVGNIAPGGYASTSDILGSTTGSNLTTSNPPPDVSSTPGGGGSSSSGSSSTGQPSYPTSNAGTGTRGARPATATPGAGTPTTGTGSPTPATGGRPSGSGAPPIGTPASAAVLPMTVAGPAGTTSANRGAGGYNPAQYATDEEARGLASLLGGTVSRTNPVGPIGPPPQNLIDVGGRDDLNAGLIQQALGPITVDGVTRARTPSEMSLALSGLRDEVARSGGSTSTIDNLIRQNTAAYASGANVSPVGQANTPPPAATPTPRERGDGIIDRTKEPPKPVVVKGDEAIPAGRGADVSGARGGSGIPADKEESTPPARGSNTSGARGGGSGSADEGYAAGGSLAQFEIGEDGKVKNYSRGGALRRFFGGGFGMSPMGFGMSRMGMGGGFGGGFGGGYGMSPMGMGMPMNMGYGGGYGAPQMGMGFPQVDPPAQPGDSTNRIGGFTGNTSGYSPDQLKQLASLVGGGNSAIQRGNTPAPTLNRTMELRPDDPAMGGIGSLYGGGMGYQPPMGYGMGSFNPMPQMGGFMGGGYGMPMGMGMPMNYGMGGYGPMMGYGMGGYSPMMSGMATMQSRRRAEGGAIRKNDGGGFGAQPQSTPPPSNLGGFGRPQAPSHGGAGGAGGVAGFWNAINPDSTVDPSLFNAPPVYGGQRNLLMGGDFGQYTPGVGYTVSNLTRGALGGLGDLPSIFGKMKGDDGQEYTGILPGTDFGKGVRTVNRAADISSTGAEAGEELLKQVGLGPGATNAPTEDSYLMSRLKDIEGNDLKLNQQISIDPLQTFQMEGPSAVTPGRTEVGEFGAPTAERYMSPYQRSVIDTQKREAQRQAAMQKAGRSAAAVRAGAFGGSRQAIQEGMADEALQRQMGDIEATGMQRAYESAQGQFERDRAASLASQQANLRAALEAQMANQQAGLTAGQANLRSKLETQNLGTMAGLDAAKANLGAQMGLTGMKTDLISRASQERQAQRQQDFQNKLGALGQVQAGASGMAGMGSSLMGIPGMAQQMELQRLAAMQQGGGYIDSLTRGAMDLDYQDFINQQNFPYQQMNFLTGIMHGVPIGYQTDQVQFQRPSAGGLSGLIASGAGLFSNLYNK